MILGSPLITLARKVDDVRKSFMDVVTLEWEGTLIKGASRMSTYSYESTPKLHSLFLCNN